MDDDRVSMLLYRTLEYIGVTEEARRIRIDNARSKEIQYTVNERVVKRNPRSIYICGSTSEGTTTFGLRSDNDIVICQENVIVKERIDFNLPEHLLIVRDETTKPGYVKLQLVNKGVPMTIDNQSDRRAALSLLTGHVVLDKKNRFIITNRSSNTPISPSATWHGPAITEEGNGMYKDVDMVNVKRCHEIPSFAREWVERYREFGWPSREVIDDMKKRGCLLARIGHPKSTEAYIEWRISFSLQERLLMHSLNSTQHKCYIMLKMIKKDIIVPDTGKGITSYHLKTSLFYTIENTGQEIWIPSNILGCIQKCLERLLEWLKKGHCPNYFVPSENMFDKVDKTTLVKVENWIKGFLQIDPIWMFLNDINCDGIGNIFFSAVFEADLKLDLQNKNIAELAGKWIYNKRMAESAFTETIDLLDERNDKIIKLAINLICNKQRTESGLLILNIFRKFGSNETALLLQFLLQVLSKIETIGPIAENTADVVQKAVAGTKCVIHLHIAICIAALVPPVQKKDRCRLVSTSFDYHIKQAEGFDLMSAMLIEATVCFNFDKLDECGEVLKKCDSVLGSTNVSACGCNLFQSYIPERMLRGFQATGQSIGQFVEHRAACCLMFHPSQVNVVPTALVFEMYRSAFTASYPREGPTNDWFDWIAVDSKVYFCFLNYILLRKSNSDSDDRFAFVHRMLHILETDYAPGHIETGYNLAGWILIQEREPSLAMDCFVKSWKLRPHHNAAKWHVACLINDLLNPFPNKT